MAINKSQLFRDAWKAARKLRGLPLLVAFRQTLTESWAYHKLGLPSIKFQSREQGLLARERRIQWFAAAMALMKREQAATIDRLGVSKDRAIAMLKSIIAKASQEVRASRWITMSDPDFILDTLCQRNAY